MNLRDRWIAELVAPLQAGRMSLARYVVVVFVVNVVAFGLFGYFLRDPAVNPGWLWRLLVGAPLIGASLALYLGRIAKRVSPELRTGFFAYKRANVEWGVLWGVVIVALVATLLGYKPH